MGKSNQFIIPEYRSMLEGLVPGSVAFLGFEREDELTMGIPGTHSFFDLALGNWEINSSWSLPTRYDLIVSTRCPYFSRDPSDFVARCHAHLNPGGRMFLDWGLGDHWRFPSFKVGWVRDGEHEHAYRPGNMLYSCLWRREFLGHPEVKRFETSVQGRFGYGEDADLDDIVRREIPYIVDYEFDRIGFKFLWPDRPQLYIMTLV